MKKKSTKHIVFTTPTIRKLRQLVIVAFLIFMASVETSAQLYFRRHYQPNTNSQSFGSKQFSDGNYAVAGYKDDAGTNYGLVMKYDQYGKVTVWDRSFVANTRLLDIRITQNTDLLVCGSSSETSTASNFLVSRIDSSGNEVWSKEYTNNSSTKAVANEIIESRNGSTIDGYVACGADGTDILITKSNTSNGTLIFSKKIDFGYTHQTARSVYQASDGGYLITGDADSNLIVFKINRTGDTILWAYEYNIYWIDAGYSIIEGIDANNQPAIFIGGVAQKRTSGLPKYSLLMCLNTTGDTVRWNHSYIYNSDRIRNILSINQEQHSGKIWFCGEPGGSTPNGYYAAVNNSGLPNGYRNCVNSANSPTVPRDVSFTKDSGLLVSGYSGDWVNLSIKYFFLMKTNKEKKNCTWDTVSFSQDTMGFVQSVLSSTVTTSSVANSFSATPSSTFNNELAFWTCADCTPDIEMNFTSSYGSIINDTLKICTDSSYIPSLTINFSKGYNYYSWQKLGSAAIDTLIDDTFFSVDTFGVYIVKGYYTNTCYKTDTVVIKKEAFPVPQFNTISTCYNPSITFIDNSTASLPDKIASVVWNFGDTTITTDTSTQRNPVYTFASLDTFNVKLVVTANNGCKDSITKAVIVPLPIAEPVAGFDTSYVTCGFDLQFQDTSYADTGNIVFRYWHFDDPSSDKDSIGFGISPLHKFTDTGNFNIRLIVYTDLGCVDTLVKTVYVSTVNPYPLQITSLTSLWKPTGNTLYAISNPYPAPQYGIYRWFRNGIPVYDDTCSCPALSTKYPGNYILQAYGDCGWENSNELVLQPLCHDSLNQTFTSSRSMASGFYNDPRGYYIGADIKVNSGDTVQFYNTALVMDDCVKINIEEGGALFIDSTIVTSCGNWQGIVVKNGGAGRGFLSLTRSYLSYASLGVFAINGGKVYMGNDTFENNYTHVGVSAGNTSSQDSTRIGRCLFGRVRRDFTTSSQTCGHDDWNGTQHYVSLSGDTAYWRPLVFIDSARDVLVTQNEFALDVFYLPSPPDTILPVNLLNERVSLFDNVTKEMIVRENEFYAIAQNQYVSKSTSDYASKFEGNILNGSGTFAVSSQLINGALFENADSMVVYNNQFHNFNRGLEMYGAGNYPDTVKDNRFENNKYGLAIAPNEWPLTANATNNTDSSLIQIQIHCNKFTSNTIAIGGSGNLQDLSGPNDPDSADVGNAFTYTTDWDFIWQDNDTSLVRYYTSNNSDTPNHNVNKPVIDINSFKVANSNFIGRIQLDTLGNPPINDNYCRAFLKTSRNNVGIDKTEVETSEKVWVYPNPFNGRLYVRSKDELSKGRVIVFDVMGRRVLVQAITGTEAEISTSHFSAGFYIIKIVEGNTIVHTQKLIKAEQ